MSNIVRQPSAEQLKQVRDDLIGVEEVWWVDWLILNLALRSGSMP
jgi:hypothetical protein